MSDLRDEIAEKIENHIPNKFEFNTTLAGEIISIVLDEHQHKIDYCNELEWMIKFMDEVEPAIRCSALDEAIEAVKTYANDIDQVVLFVGDVEEVIEKIKTTSANE